jgi:hypothetical protein
LGPSKLEFLRLLCRIGPGDGDLVAPGEDAGLAVVAQNAGREGEARRERGVDADEPLDRVLVVRVARADDLVAALQAGGGSPEGF